jgi:alpha-glucosidase (family GH31 glycosyl hydrolase)
MNFDGLWLDMNEPTTFCNGSYPICNSNRASEKYNYTDKIYKKIQDLQ